MRNPHLLVIVAIALFAIYSAVVTVTSGAASLIASPLVIAAIGSMVWHDRITEAA